MRKRYKAADIVLPPGSRSFARVADIGRKARREAAHSAKADKPKRYEPRPRLQELRADCPNFLFRVHRRRGRPLLAPALPGAHAGLAR